jgi:3-isopropylmalate/(R)-2-methylmalate dehydratase large subunit
MKPMTMAEKILAARSHLGYVEPGQIVEAEADFTLTNDTSGHLLARVFREAGVERIWDPEKFSMALDHFAPSDTPEGAKGHGIIRMFAREFGVKHLYDINDGNHLHNPLEDGLIRPGMLVPGNDSHCTLYGAVGAFGTSLSITETVELLATGRMWFKVPRTMKIHVHGRLQPGVMGKDLALEVLGCIGTTRANYTSIEFGGGAVSGMGMDDRITLCCLGAEMGAKASMIEPDDVTAAFFAGMGMPQVVSGPTAALAKTDPDAFVSETIEIDGSSLGPRLACPGSVSNLTPVESVAGRHVDQVFIGSCTNGRLNDLRTAAGILSGRHVHPYCRLIINPITRSQYLAALREGLIETFVEAGAVVCNPGCGACTGASKGALAPHEVCVSTANRNFAGRMGSREAEIYLASPAVAAATAVAGVIADPRPFMRGE